MYLPPFLPFSSYSCSPSVWSNPCLLTDDTTIKSLQLQTNKSNHGVHVHELITSFRRLVGWTIKPSYFNIIIITIVDHLRYYYYRYILIIIIIIIIIVLSPLMDANWFAVARHFHLVHLGGGLLSHHQQGKSSSHDVIMALSSRPVLPWSVRIIDSHHTTT